LVDRVPTAPHDVPVHALATEIRTLPMPG
jgi:5-formyltetrahydrofolate cyclo-ligase